MKRLLVRVDGFANDVIIEDDGAIKWDGNGRYLFEETMNKLKEQGLEFSVEATNLKRREQLRALMKEREERNKEERYSELLSEMRNTFGAGAKVVNVLTGKEIEL